MENQLEQELAGAARALAANLTTHLESCNVADPMEPYMGPDGEIWEPISHGAAGFHLHEESAPYKDTTGLDQVRRVCRFFAKENPFAINGHENRISYIVGAGHNYTAVDRYLDSASDEQKTKVQNWVDDWVRVNRWKSRQQENVLRVDRDGENFLRFFPNEDGLLRVRYVEPYAVRPKEAEDRPHFSFGIQTDPEDHETVLSYLVDGEEVEADEIQHRKRGTSDCKRGTPIFWAVRHNLTRALKILRNGSTVTEIQTAIGMIRKFVDATGTTVKAWAAQQNEKVAGVEDPPDTSGKLYQKYSPGTILTANRNTEYEFPGMGVDPSKYVDALQAEIRAIAARLVMSESMFSAKTDDTSRAAAEIAEGPITRNFERLQSAELEADEEVLERAMESAVETNALTQAEVDAVRIEATPPTLQVRNQKEEAERQAIQISSKVLSVQTARAESGYDDETEQANIEEMDERNGTPLSDDRPTDFLNVDDEEDGDSDE